MEIGVPGIIRIAIAGGIACLSGLLGACAKTGDAASAPPPPQVSVAAVLEKRVKDWDEFTGRFQAVETVEIRPRVSGYIDRVAFKEGSGVKAGD
jgi:multidrug efflux pump subunit AcrA (membrane-fusion protein)